MTKASDQSTGGRRRPAADKPRYSKEVRALLKQMPKTIEVRDPQPWPGSVGSSKPILLVPAADYHLDELVPLSHELNQRGLETVFAVGESPWNRTKRGMIDYPEVDMFRLPDPEVVEEYVRLVVTLKDTGSMTDWVTEVRERGVPVIGKVEGAQDFWDSDTPDERRPYRNFDLVLCQGQFDADALADVETAIVGSTRLERLWSSPPVEPPEQPLALINLNFVYGVRTHDRRLWLETAIAGCKQAGIDYLISAHPAEKTRTEDARITRVSAMKLLPHSSALISRFSTVPLEAMAMGVPVVYHNPHSESVATFHDPTVAFDTSDSADSLAAALSSLTDSRRLTRQTAARWFNSRVSVEAEQLSESRGADAVVRILINTD